MALSFNSKPNLTKSDAPSVNQTQSKAIKSSTSKNDDEDILGFATNPDAEKTTSSSSSFNTNKMFKDFLGKNNQGTLAAGSAASSQPGTPWLGSGASNPSLGSNNSGSSNNKSFGGGGSIQGNERNNSNPPDLPKLDRKITGEDDPLVPNPDNVKLTQTEFDVIRYTNALRQAAGKDPLIVKADLIETARLSSERMDAQNDMRHGKAPGSWTGENIAAGQNSAEEVMNSWKNSPDHFANIMRDDIQYIGVGDTKEADGAVYWTQQFF